MIKQLSFVAKEVEIDIQKPHEFPQCNHFVLFQKSIYLPNSESV